MLEIVGEYTSKVTYRSNVSLGIKTGYFTRDNATEILPRRSLRLECKLLVLTIVSNNSGNKIKILVEWQEKPRTLRSYINILFLTYLMMLFTLMGLFNPCEGRNASCIVTFKLAIIFCNRFQGVGKYFRKYLAQLFAHIPVKSCRIISLGKSYAF